MIQDTTIADVHTGLAQSKVASDPSPDARNCAEHTCRFCGSGDLHLFLDLGMSPLCESFVPRDELNEMEAFYPLRTFVCGDCFLVQVPAIVSPDIKFVWEIRTPSLSKESGHRVCQLILESKSVS